MKRLLLIAAILFSATSAHAGTNLRVGDKLMFNVEKMGCNNSPLHAGTPWLDRVNCHALPAIEWKVVLESPEFNFSDRADFCIIAANPMNPGPSGSGPQTKEEIEAAEKKFCVWVRLNKQP